jgi:chitinase
MALMYGLTRTLVGASEIKDALNLLWRNDVPASQVNLGLGFYGRSYTLKDPNCWQPGCIFESAGNAGTCSVSAR